MAIRWRAILSALLAAGFVLGTTRPVRADLDPATRRKVFDAVWTKVRDTHWDPTYGGVDWNKIRTRYAPKVAAVKSDGAFYQLIQTMLGELGQSHFHIIPPEAYVASDTTGGVRDGDGATGMTIGLVDGRAVVMAVDSDSAAAEAGVAPGWTVVAVGNTKVDPLLAKIKARKLKPAAERVEVRTLAMGLLAGQRGDTVRVSFEGREPVALVRRAPKGVASRMGNLPPMPAFVETKALAGGIGYIRINIFLVEPVMQQVREAVESFADAPALVFDLRGNPGGVGGMASGIAGMLVASGRDKYSLGSMKMRKGEIRFAVNPQPPFFTKPVAVLIDEMSLSTSELFAGGLQEMNRVVVVGRRTGGMVLPSNIEKLPGGVRFQYAVADFKTPKGVLLEGRGVIPDIAVELTRTQLLRGGDPTLDAALGALQRKIGARAKS
ncbi:MAG: S41 family peptidase [Armatimonadaceae bacterium]|jgi:carboxyl-terminal processing protease